MDLGTRLTIFLRGRLVGSDAVGNHYYLEKSKRRGSLRARRWVTFAGEKEASAVPAEWHAWLHYTTERPIPETGKHPWQKPHLPNATGTPSGYRPPATTIAAVVDPLRTAIMSPGRQAIGEALPQGWQRWSRQAVVEWREDARLNGHCDAAAASVCTIG